jgi:hypothetical protein
MRFRMRESLWRPRWGSGYGGCVVVRCVRRVVLWAGVALVVSTGLVPAAADATTCAWIPGYDPYRAADVVVDGVLLSGPSRGGSLISPARFQVRRYVKGSGPRRLRVRTVTDQVLSGDFPGAFLQTPGRFFPRPGETYRLFGRTPRRAAGAITVLGEVCGDDYAIRPRRVLAPLAGRAARVGSGRGVWRARLYRGAAGVLCLRLGRRPDRFSASSDCRPSPRGRRLLALARRRGPPASTAIAVALRRLQAVTVERVADRLAVEATARRGVALAVLPALANRQDLRVTVRLAGGATRTLLEPTRRTQAADPTGEQPWVADFERAYPRSARRTACVAVTQRESLIVGAPALDELVRGRCGDLRRRPFFFGVGRAYGYESQPSRPRVRQTVVFGAIGSEVADVHIAAAGERRRPSISPRGRAFLAVYAGDIAADDISISFRHRDGSQTTRVAHSPVDPERRTTTTAAAHQP